MLSNKGAVQLPAIFFHSSDVFKRPQLRGYQSRNEQLQKEWALPSKFQAGPTLPDVSQMIDFSRWLTEVILAIIVPSNDDDILSFGRSIPAPEACQYD